MNSSGHAKVVDRFKRGEEVVVEVVADTVTGARLTSFALPLRPDVAVNVLCDADGALTQVVLSDGRKVVTMYVLKQAPQEDQQFPPEFVCKVNDRVVGSIVGERPDMVLAKEFYGRWSVRLASFYGSVSRELLAFIHQQFPARATVTMGGGR